MDPTELPKPHIAGIKTKPAPGQIIEDGGETFTTVREGRAFILIPSDTPVLDETTPAKDGTLPPARNVFYNPIQEYNRDLTILAIRVFGEDYVENARSSLQLKRAKERKKRKRKDEEKAKDQALSRDEPEISKRLRAEEPSNEFSQPVSSRPETKIKENGTEQPLHPIHLTLDEIDMDDIDDEDFIAVASSIPEPSPKTASKPSSNDKEMIAENSIAKPKPGPKFEILDALSATGLRALRYAQELPFVTSVTANDLSKKAVQAIQRNIDHNGLQEKVKTSVGNANAHMYNSIPQDVLGFSKARYAVIDLDPYGTAVPFLDAAVQAIADDGLLCVTCTDTGVLNSVGYLEKAFALYGGLPTKGSHCHEGGLRLILHAISTAAAKYGKSVEPLLSLSIDYYARVFVRVKRSPNDVKLLAGKTMIVYACDVGCGAWQTQFLARHTAQDSKHGNVFRKYIASQGPTTEPNCPHCGMRTHVSRTICAKLMVADTLQIAGPMYGGPLHNTDFINRMLSHIPGMDKAVCGTKDRLEGMLSTALEEAEVYDAYFQTKPQSEGKKSRDGMLQRVDPAVVDKHPFYFAPTSVARVLHCQSPSVAQMRGALRYRGFRATGTHAKPGMIKTDAPWSEIWSIMLEWIRQHAPVTEGRVKEGMPGWKLLQRLHTSPASAGSDGSDKEGGVKLGAEKTTEPNGAGDGDGSKSKDAEKPWVVFDEKLGEDTAKGKLLRYQINPRANWGPMAKAR